MNDDKLREELQDFLFQKNMTLWDIHGEIVTQILSLPVMKELRKKAEKWDIFMVECPELSVDIEKGEYHCVQKGRQLDLLMRGLVVDICDGPRKSHRPAAAVEVRELIEDNLNNVWQEAGERSWFTLKSGAILRMEEGRS